MSSSVNTAVNFSTQNSVNTILQESNSMCWAQCNADIEDVNIIIDNGSRIGDILIQEECHAAAMCTMKTELDAIATQQLSAIQLSEANHTGGFLLTWPGFSVNTTTNMVNQSLENTITQSINSVCVANVDLTTSNINVYANNDSEIAGFTLSQQGNATADCYIENTGKVKAAQAASVEQVAASTSGSVLMTIILSIIVAVVVLGIFYLNSSTTKTMVKSEQMTAQQALATGNEEIVRLYFASKGNLPLPSSYYTGISPVA